MKFASTCGRNQGEATHQELEATARIAGLTLKIASTFDAKSRLKARSQSTQ